MSELALNEYGRVVTVMTCSSCGREFTVTGEHTAETWGTGCTMPDCDTYDLSRDVEWMFGGRA